MLTPAQLRGAAALPDPLPAVDTPQSGEVGRLTVAERRILLFTALSMTRRVSILLEAAALDSDILLFGRLRHHLGVSGGRLRFTHEHTRSEVIAQSDPAERRAAHLALARTAQRAGDSLAVAWHMAHIGTAPDARTVRALQSAANELLRRGEIREAQKVAVFAAEAAPSGDAGASRITAGLAAFWAGELDDAAYWLDDIDTACDPAEIKAARSVLLVRHALTSERDSIYSADEASQVFDALVAAGCSAPDRQAMTQLRDVANTLYSDPDEADSLQARLFLSLGGSAESAVLSPHAETQVLMMQVAFQSQGGDRAGAARILRDAVPRLPLVLAAAGIVSSYVRLLAEYDPLLDETLARAYEAVGPERPLRYNGDGASLGHGREVGTRSAAADGFVTAPECRVRPLVHMTVGLSARERDVLALLLDGRSNREISASLSISHRTVEVHVSSILRKHEVRSRTALLARVSGLHRSDSTSARSEITSAYPA